MSNPKPTSVVTHRTEGTCAVHGHQLGRILTGSDIETIQSLPISRITSDVQADCGCLGKMVTGSRTRFTDGTLAVTRIGDDFEGTYSGKVIEGFDWHLTDD